MSFGICRCVNLIEVYRHFTETYVLYLFGLFFDLVRSGQYDPQIRG
jgi:hypothetical protein